MPRPTEKGTGQTIFDPPTNYTTDTRSASATTNPMAAAMAAAQNIPNATGAKTKAEKELAKLEGQIKKQLQEQQYKYQLKLQEQQQKMALEELQAKQAYEKPFSEAELTGFYNGSETINLKQLNQQGSQFNQSLTQQQTEFTKTLEQKVLDRELDTMRLDLDKLAQQQRNAIEQGQLDLSRQIDTEKLALQKEIQRGELALETSKTTGKMPDGTFTDAARAARVNEAMEMAKITGQVVPSYVTSSPTGNVGGFQYNDEASYNEAWRQASAAGTAPATQMTDAAQQWRTQAGLDYAKTAAQLAQNPENYFEAAAFMRNGMADASRGFLDAINTNGLGSNMGFRSGATGNLPGTASMQTITGRGTPTNPAPVNEPTPPGGFNRNAMAISQFITENPGFTPQQAEAWLASNPEGAVGMLQRARERLGQTASGDIPSNATAINQFMTENPGFDAAAARSWLASNPEGARGMLQRGNERLGTTNPINRGFPDGVTTGNSEIQYAGGSPGFNERGMEAQRAKWNALDPATQQQYIQGGGAPSFATEGPSRSISNAEGVRAGEGEIYTTTMHKEGVPAQTKAVPAAVGDAFTSAQAAMPAPQPGTPQNIPTPAAANVGDPYSIQDRQRLNQYGTVFKAGAHKLAPGALESMNPTERSLFNSAARASGIRPEDFDTQYKRSRLQTDVSAMAL